MKRGLLPLLFAVALSTLVATAANPLPQEWPQWVSALKNYSSGQDMTALRQLEKSVLQTRSGSLRAAMEPALLDIVTGAASPEARLFAARLLAAVATESSVPRLAPLLVAPETSGLACLALSTLKATEVDAALCAALPTATGLARAQIAMALGQRRCADAVELLVPLTRDPVASGAAMSALARIGTARAAAALADCRQARVEGADAASMELLQTWREAGRTALVQELAAALLTADRPAAVRRGSFSALLATDRDGGVERSAEVVARNDAILLPVAITAMAQDDGRKATEHFTELLSKSPTGTQLLGIDALSRRTDRAARVAVQRFLNARDEAVRSSAIAALGQMGDENEVPVLLALVAREVTVAEATAVANALAQLRGGAAVDKALARVLSLEAPVTQMTALTALSRRRAEGIVSSLLVPAGSTNAGVAGAAWSVIGKVGRGSDAPAVLAAAVAVPDALRADAFQAAKMVVGREPSAKIRARLVLDEIKRVDDPALKASLVRLLPASGDDRALQAAVDFARGADAALADAGIRALSDWPDATAWDALVGIYTGQRTDVHRSLAWRGLTRLVGSSEPRPGAATVARVLKLLELAASDADRKEALGPVGDIADAAVLAAVRQMASTHPAVRAEAEAAAQRIAGRLKTP